VLPAPNLDDRTFQDIVDEAKRRIPSLCPEWTNHNVSDPGVALIEIFAWMSEMILFRLNQVPDRLYLKFLELVGIEPFAPAVARTNLVFWLAAVLDHPVLVPKGTEVASDSVLTGGDEVVFTTVEDLMISPPELVAARTAEAGNDELSVDVWDELRYQGGEVICFPSQPAPVPGDAVYFGFEHSIAGNAIRLLINARIEGIGVDPRNPPLVWETWSGERWAALTVDGDTTGGLNTEGQVTLLVPMNQSPLTLGSRAAYWIRARLTEAHGGQPVYQRSPRITGLRAETLGGTVSAEHGTTVAMEAVGRSDGGPGQAFAASRTPVLPRREGERVRTIGVGPAEDWEEVDDFSSSGPGDRHVTWDGASGTIRFGPLVRYPDGGARQHGAVPADGAQVTVTGYRSGGGARGNVGARTLTVLRTTVAFVSGVENPNEASGGVDGESVANAKVRGPMSLRTGQRAVTPGDFERLGLEASTGVARVRCVPPSRAGDPVRLLVVPRVQTKAPTQRIDDFALTDELIGRVRGHIDRRRTLGTVVEVMTPYYEGVTVAALLRALPGRSPAVLQHQALDLLYEHANPLVGGPEGRGWPFDTDLSAAPIAERLAAIDGVDRVEEVLLFEYDLRRGRRLGPGRELIRLGPNSLFLSAGHEVIVR
jgi:predicted phage baseplate assembly protein